MINMGNLAVKCYEFATKFDRNGLNSKTKLLRYISITTTKNGNKCMYIKQINAENMLLQLLK